MIDESARKAIADITKNLNSAFAQLKAVQNEFSAMKTRFNAVDNRLLNIEKLCE